jgi:phosphatidylserine/phosphatidylglycerophosphate/cardiolipin synthase-like enzyme
VRRQVKINLLLESPEKQGGGVNNDSIKAISEKLPSIDIYVWPPEKKAILGEPLGKVHAKCAVADGEQAFITSANLTEPAMERNMELGVLVKGGNLPTELFRHLETLISTKIIEKISNPYE